MTNVSRQKALNDDSEKDHPAWFPVHRPRSLVRYWIAETEDRSGRRRIWREDRAVTVIYGLSAVLRIKELAWLMVGLLWNTSLRPMNCRSPPAAEDFIFMPSSFNRKQPMPDEAATEINQLSTSSWEMWCFNRSIFCLSSKAQSWFMLNHVTHILIMLWDRFLIEICFIFILNVFLIYFSELLIIDPSAEE